MGTLTVRKKTKSPPKTAQQTRINLKQLTASICRDSLFEFVKEFWHEVVPETPIWNWHIKYICDELQTIAERVFKSLPKEHDFLCNVPPGTTKSTIFSIMLPAWAWTRMPSARFICGSYADTLALDLSRKCRDVITSEKYRDLFPGIDLREDQNTKGYFANVFGGIRYAVGVGSSVIGMHGHFLIVDDPIDPMKAVSEAALKEVNLWMTEQLSQRKVNKAVSVSVLIMQRLHQDDPAGNLISRKTPLRHICLPARLSDKVKPVEARAYYSVPDGLLDPVRISEAVLLQAFKELGESGFAGQYDQHPVPPGGSMFKIERLMQNMQRSAPQKMKYVVRFWDKACSKNTGAYTVGTKMGKDMEGRFWVMNVVRGQWNTAERENVILQTARTDGKLVTVGIEQEPGSGGKESAEGTVRRLAGFRARIYKPSASDGSKIARADPFSTQVNSGNVYMVLGPWNEVFLSEMRYFPYSKYKDQIDSASGAFTLLTKPVIRIGVL